MRRMVFAMAACVLGGVLPALAQDEKPKVVPAQPKVVQPVQPLPVRPVPVTAAKMAQLEEEAEALDAHREVKKAHVKAAEIGVRAAEINLDRISRLLASNTVSKEDAERAKLEVEMAKAQVAIRVAELKEVEVKVKFARKRLEDAKAAGVRPNPFAPKPADPSPVRLAADEKEVAELKVKLAKVRDEAALKAAAVKKAEALVKVAEDDLAKLKDAATKGRVRAGAIEALEAKVIDAKDALTKATKESKALDEEVAALQKKLKEIEK